MGEGAGDCPSNTVMASFWFPFAQSLGTQQMYHFFPGVFRGITSFPLVNSTDPADALQRWKSVPLTLKALCTPFLWLKTAPRN